MGFPRSPVFDFCFRCCFRRARSVLFVSLTNLLICELPAWICMDLHGCAWIRHGFIYGAAALKATQTMLKLNAPCRRPFIAFNGCIRAHVDLYMPNPFPVYASGLHA